VSVRGKKMRDWERNMGRVKKRTDFSYMHFTYAIYKWILWLRHESYLISFTID